MKSYECTIFMGSVRNGSEGTRFFESDVIEVIRHFQSMNLDPKVTIRITQTRFVFMHYEEPGFEISAIQYPGFPTTEFKIRNWMNELGLHLKVHFDQKSVSIVDANSITYLGVPNDNSIT